MQALVGFRFHGLGLGLSSRRPHLRCGQELQESSGTREGGTKGGGGGEEVGWFRV